MASVPDQPNTPPAAAADAMLEGTAEAQPDSAAAEAEYDRFVRANLRRNYAGHYLHGMLGMTGFRLVNAPTFIPAYLHSLSGSDAIVGLGLGLQQLGAMLSPILGASHIEHKQKVMPTAVWMGTAMRVPVLLMAVAGWTLSGQPLLTALLVLLFLFGLAGGVQRVVFQLLLAKVIPIDRRGRLQAWRNATGGLIAALLSYFAGRFFIEHDTLGNGYSTTFLLAFVLTTLGLTALRLLMVEPVPPSVRGQARLRDRLRDFPQLLREDRDFRNYLVVLVLAMGGRIAAPFYVLHAGETLGMSGATLGLLSIAYLGADTVANLAWGYLGDKTGFRSTFVASLVLWSGATVLLLFAQQEWAILLAFVGLGAANSGYQMSSTTMVLEFGAREDVAMRLAIGATVEGVMSAGGPLAGGLLASATGYPVVFGVSIGMLLAALALLLGGVREPRTRRTG